MLYDNDVRIVMMNQHVSSREMLTDIIVNDPSCSAHQQALYKIDKYWLSYDLGDDLDNPWTGAV
jgi:hypothetical protein